MHLWYRLNFMYPSSKIEYTDLRTLNYLSRWQVRSQTPRIPSLEKRGSKSNMWKSRKDQNHCILLNSLLPSVDHDWRTWAIGSWNGIPSIHKQCLLPQPVYNLNTVSLKYMNNLTLHYLTSRVVEISHFNFCFVV
jgi:hypothetical protein